MMNKFRFLIGFALVTILMAAATGCTHHFVPREYPIDEALLPPLSGDNPIKLTNMQDDTNEVLIGKNGAHKFMANLHEFTDIAIDTIKTELQKRGIEVKEEAEKELRLSVIKVFFESRWSGVWCDVEIAVETGDGYKGQVDGHDSNAWVLPPAVHGALNSAVVTLLNDDSIIAYLKKQ